MSISDYDRRPRLMNWLHNGILAAFRAAGVEIPFPQRDLHFKIEDAVREVFGQGRIPDPTPFTGPALPE